MTYSPENPLRLAMWSGPRNISTAMMRSWGNRQDTWPNDEPLYGHYLQITKLDHPGADEVIADMECDWEKVVTALKGPVPNGKAIHYQKHMTHHLMPHMDRDWVHDLVNVFLIRDPARMLRSLHAKLETFVLEETGLPQQAELFERVCERLGAAPPVIDAKDVLMDPRAVLAKLCAALDVPFDEAMLAWPEGPRETDGIWAKYWYHSVEKSTHFMPYKPDDVQLDGRLAELYEQCRPFYDALYKHRIV